MIPPSWSPLTPRDVDAWVGLFAAAEEREPTGEHIGREELLEDLDDPRLPPGAASGAWRGGRMVAYVLVRARGGAGTTRFLHAEALVHPECRDAAMARGLLHRVEETSSRVHTVASDRADREIRIFVHERQRWMARVLTESGFRPARTFVDLAMDLTGPMPPGPLPAGLRIAPFTQERSEAARLARNDAFAGHWGSTGLDPGAWRHKVAASAFRPGLSFLVLTPEEGVAALALASHFPEESREAGRDELCITDVGTREPWRRRGLAGALLRRMITTGYELGYRGAVIGVDHAGESGALRLYTGIGFSPVQRWTVHAR